MPSQILHRTENACCLLVGLLMLCFASSAAKASDYYVDGLNGIDTPSAGTQAQPWKTIAYGLARVPAPSSGFHRLVIAGGQDYRFDATIQMRDGIYIAGAGAQRPRFVPGAATTYFRIDTTGTGTDFAILNADFVGGALAVATGTATTARPALRLVDCDFTALTSAVLKTTFIAGSLDVSLRSCAVSMCGQGVALDARGPASVTLGVEGCDFGNTTGEAIALRASAAASLRAAVSTSRFRFCRRAIDLETSSGRAARLDVARASFRDNFVHAVGVRANSAGAQIAVEESVFLRDDVAISLFGRDASQGSSFRAVQNVVVASKSAGLVVDLGSRVATSARWDCVAEYNRYDSCARNVRVATSEMLVGTWSAHGEQSHRSLAEAMRFELGASGNFATRLENCILTRGAAGGLWVGGPGSLDAFSLTIADHSGGPALDTSGSTGAITCAHLALDNSAPVEIAGHAQLTLGFSCSRTTAKLGILADPLLVRPHYKLAPGSPCIDARTNPVGSRVLDYEGEPRLLGGKYDLGADEFEVAGTIRSYGPPSWGIDNALVPRVELLATQAKIGTSVPLGLQNALDRNGKPALLALVLFGLGEAEPLVDFDPVGVPGAMLFFPPLTVPQAVLVDAQGKARDILPIPNAPGLVGDVFSAQWWVLHVDANALGFTFSEGIRLQVGR